MQTLTTQMKRHRNKLPTMSTSLHESPGKIGDLFGIFSGQARRTFDLEQAGKKGT
jgi:hypothetical protein